MNRIPSSTSPYQTSSFTSWESDQEEPTPLSCDDAAMIEVNVICETITPRPFLQERTFVNWVQNHSVEMEEEKDLKPKEVEESKEGEPTKIPYSVFEIEEEKRAPTMLQKFTNWTQGAFGRKKQE